MRFLKPLSIFSFVALAAAPGLFGQTRPVRPDRSKAGREITRPSVSRPSTRPANTTPAPSAPASTPAVGTSNRGPSTSSNRPSRNPYYNDCDRYVNGIWYYNPYYRNWYSWRDRYRYYSLFSRLGWQYGFYGRQLTNSLRRLSYADNPLTSDMVKLLLRDSNQAAKALLADTNSLKLLISDFESGAIRQAVFEKQSRELLDRIRKSAKAIRKDYYVEFVDSDNDVKPKDYDPVSDLEGMRSLVADLEGLALQMQSRLYSIASDEDVRTVSIRTLQEPSLDSLSKGIDELAKTLKKSSKRL